MDITERRQLQKDLKSSEERFRAISASSMDAMIVSDQNDKFYTGIRAAEKLLATQRRKLWAKN